jgi:hypothetical protein
MADLKISALTASTTPLAGTEVLPIVQSSTTKQVSVANLTAGRAVSATSVALNGATSALTPAFIRNGSFSCSSFGADKQLATFGAYNDDLTNGGFVLRALVTDVVTEIARGGAAGLTVTSGNLIIGTSGNGVSFAATPGTGTSELLADYEEGTWTPTAGAGLTVIGTFSSSGTYTKVGRMVTLNFRLLGSTSVAFTGVVEIAAGLPFAVFSDSIGAYGSLINANATAGATCQAFSSVIYGEVNSIAATTAIYGSVTYIAA